jgi:hypothetical protein
MIESPKSKLGWFAKLFLASVACFFICLCGVLIIVATVSHRLRVKADQLGKSLPYASGVIGEIWHNHKYVFGLYSRYNAADSVKGWKEAADILERNCALHTEPTLYPKP